MKDDASRSLVERLAGHPGMGDSSRTAALTVVGWHVTSAAPTGCSDGGLTLELADGDDVARATVLVSWSRGQAYVLPLRCDSIVAERWLLSRDGERAVLAAFRRAA